MRPISALALVAALGALAPLASASPRGATPSLPLAADVQVVGETLAARPYGYRFVGGYYRTDYYQVWVDGPVSHVNAFGRVYRHPGHYEWLPYRTWVPYSVRYARPRPSTGF